MTATSLPTHVAFSATDRKRAVRLASRGPKRIAFYLSALAAALSPLVVVLPDTAPGSPRSILIATIAGIVSASLLLRGPT